MVIPFFLVALPQMFDPAAELDNQSQVGLDHLVTRFRVPVLDAGRQFRFFLRREQLDLADFPEIERNGRIASFSETLTLQEFSSHKHCLLIRRGKPSARNVRMVREGKQFFLGGGHCSFSMLLFRTL